MAQAVLNQQAVTFLNRYSHLLDSLHVSNEYTGYLPDVDDSTEVVVVRKPQNRLEMTFKCELSWTSVSAGLAVTDSWLDNIHIVELRYKVLHLLNMMLLWWENFEGYYNLQISRKKNTLMDNLYYVQLLLLCLMFTDVIHCMILLQWVIQLMVMTL